MIENYIVQDGFFPDDDLEVFCHCEECGEEIYVGDDYYEISGEAYCQSCADEIIWNMRRTAERIGA